MGTCISSKGTQQKSKKIQILITGLQGVGKSVIFFKLTGHPSIIEPVSTTGINSEVMIHQDNNITFLQLGQSSIQNIMGSTRQPAIKGLMYVVDTSSKSNLKEDSMYFRTLTSMLSVPVVLYMTKNDRGVLGKEEIEEHFMLGKMRQKYIFQSCNGVTGEGVDEGLAWLFEEIVSRKL